ncbi:MAG TPA: family 16 glycoside hydrolase [Gemmataceae bacterium]|nr:family 16 glycoside hydrolase [Gemmataceae bacterium]
MSSSPERPPRTLGDIASDASEDATLLPPDAASITAPYVPKAEPSSKLPTKLPAPFGRYQLQKLLGRGGMGAVYLAHDSQLDRFVALKIPLFAPEEGSQLLARFYREARAAATLHHANVCPLYDVGEVDGVPYLTMAYIEGKSLAAYLRGKTLMPRQSALLVRKLALALHEAHKKGVIHRDLKPANIMLDKRGEPVIMDFGLARRESPGDARLTQMGTVLGTPAYMPPEQISGNTEAVGPACDVYSLGIILYELVTGRLPFHGDSMAMLSQVLLEEPPPPSKFRADLDAELERICLKAMAKKVEDRFASMAEFASALQEYLRNAIREAPPPVASPIKPAPKEPAEAEDTADWHTVVDPAPESKIIKVEREKKRNRQLPHVRALWIWIACGTITVLLFTSILVLALWHNKRPTTAPKSVPPIVREREGFVPLFDGKDLAGWEMARGDPAVWRVVDGTMVFTLTDPPRQRGWLVTERDYTDFLLRFEFQLSPGANSGIGLRMWPGSPKPLEIQIQDDTFPGFAGQGPNERTGALYGVAGGPGTGVGLRALGEWNQMEIDLRGWLLRVAVNGKAALETRLNDDRVFRFLDGAPPAGGRIGLQHWLGSVRFRNLEMKDLSRMEDAAIKRENP